MKKDKKVPCADWTCDQGTFKNSATAIKSSKVLDWSQLRRPIWVGNSKDWLCKSWKLCCNESFEVLVPLRISSAASPQIAPCPVGEKTNPGAWLEMIHHILNKYNNISTEILSHLSHSISILPIYIIYPLSRLSTLPPDQACLKGTFCTAKFTSIHSVPTPSKYPQKLEKKTLHFLDKIPSLWGGYLKGSRYHHGIMASSWHRHSAIRHPRRRFPKHSEFDSRGPRAPGVDTRCAAWGAIRNLRSCRSCWCPWRWPSPLCCSSPWAPYASGGWRSRTAGLQPGTGWWLRAVRSIESME